MQVDDIIFKGMQCFLCVIYTLHAQREAYLDLNTRSEVHVTKKSSDESGMKQVTQGIVSL